MIAASAIAAVLITVYAIQPTFGVGIVAYPALLLAPAIALTGTLRAPRGSRLMPALLTAGLAASALGDLAWLAAIYILGQDPTVSPGDAIDLAGYAFLAAMLLVVTAARRGDRIRVDLDAVIDVATVTTSPSRSTWQSSTTSWADGCRRISVLSRKSMRTGRAQGACIARRRSDAIPSRLASDGNAARCVPCVREAHTDF